MDTTTYRIKNWLKGVFTFHTFLAFVLFLLIMVAVSWLLNDFYYSYYTGQLQPHRHHSYYAGSVSPANINNIQPWMTFDYLNVVFHLPPNYLKDSLKISDSRYPKIQIAQYAQRIHVSSQQEILAIEGAIRNYGKSR